jgi:ketosteroid isomerase-like protein
MTETTGKALSVAKIYVEAIASKDVNKLMSVSAEDIICMSPLGQIAGAPAFRGFQEGFAKMIKQVNIVAVFGDDEHAVVVYDADTHPVANAVVAEHLVVRNGKIASTRVIYDATPFAAYVASLQAQH